MKIDWMKKLSGLDGALNDYRDIHSTVIQTASPSLNFIYGNGWGLPRGYSVMLYGPPKGGKSVISYLMAGGIHRDYPEGIVLKFNTEYREQGQMQPKDMPRFGIDPERWKAIEANDPKYVYDQLCGPVAEWCKDGMPLVGVIIDSMNGVKGRREMGNEKGIMTQQIGDVAATNKQGLKDILDLQRRFQFGLIMTCHVGIEMDIWEVKRGNKFRMGAGVGVQHHVEYFMYVEPNRNVDGKADRLGNKLEDASKGLGTDEGKKKDSTAHKIRVVMKDSTLGPKGRFGEFTFDYQKGVINQFEEVFLLGYNRGVILKDGAHYYTVPGVETPKIKGEANFLEFLKTAPDIQEHILKELRRQDMTGLSKEADARDAAVWATPTIPEERNPVGAEKDKQTEAL